MRGSLSLHRSLFRRQKSLIAQAMEAPSRAFRAYESRYRHRTARFQHPVSDAHVLDEVSRADVVYVGDYHTLKYAQQSYLQLVEHATALGRRVVLGLEFVEGRHQRTLSSFLQGRLTETTFLTRIGHPYQGGFDIWPNFRPIFELARRARLEVVGIDYRATGPHALERRDLYAARKIAQVAKAPDRPLVMVLMGQYHLAPCHLPERVQSALGEESARSHLIVYQNCESIYWQLAQRGLAHQVSAVQIRQGELCLLNASPVVCQQSYLDYLEAEAGDASIGLAAPTRFRELALFIGRFVGVDVRPQLDELEITSPENLNVLALAKVRGNLSERELASLQQQALSQESYYVPRARLVYLATSSLNHAAEEATHFVRHCTVGDAMDSPRSSVEAFYARCMEEAIGFLGSKLVNPQRRCSSVSQWAQAFQHKRGEERQAAAFVLAHKAAERDPGAPTAQLLPLRQDRLFNAVSHGLGYLLGDALFRALESKQLTRQQLRSLFRDPLPEAQASYFAWVRRLKA